MPQKLLIGYIMVILNIYAAPIIQSIPSTFLLIYNHNMDSEEKESILWQCIAMCSFTKIQIP